MKKVVILLSLFVLLVSVEQIEAQDKIIRTTIEKIVDNPGKYDGNVVEITGIMENMVEDNTETTNHYLLKGEYGSIIKVNTAKLATDINKKYKVVGIVYIDNLYKDPFISEQSRELIDSNTPYLLYFAIFVIIIILIVLLFKSRANSLYSGISDDDEPTTVSTPIKETPVVQNNDFKTIKYEPDPKTVKFIPGQLVIISGEDKGKAFRIAGYPTSEGSVVTIGRKSISGERASAHIQLDKRFMTVSGMQAEIIASNGNLYVKNLGKTNPTQVDGIELKEGEKVEVKNGSVIRMGELELQYNI